MKSVIHMTDLYLLSSAEIMVTLGYKKVRLCNNYSRHSDYPLLQYKIGTIFTVIGVGQDSTHQYPALLLKNVPVNPFTINGGYCITRFDTIASSRIYESGGNV